jgi:hypothetical protein
MVKKEMDLLRAKRQLKKLNKRKNKLNSRAYKSTL